VSADNEALDFGTVAKHPNERITLEFNFYPNLADYWEPGHIYRAGDIARPLLPNGFAHMALTDGTSENREPKWAKTTGGVTKDGSLTWESIPAGNNGVDIIVAAGATPSAGLGIPIPVTWDGSLAQVTIDGGSLGADYPLQCQVTTQRGAILVGIMEVQVRSRNAGS
jgi:hypothetical protein